MKKSVYADMSLLVVAVIWGSGFIVTKNALDALTPHYLNGIRFVLSFTIMSIVFHKKIKTITKDDLINGIIVGLFLYGAFATQTIGMQYTTVSKSAFLTGTNVVMVPFIAWAISKKFPGMKSLLGVTLTIIGIGLLTLDGKEVSISIGDTLTLICAFLFAAHICSIEYYSQKTDPYKLAIIQIGTVGIISIIIGVLTEPVPTMNIGAMKCVIYLAVVSTTIAFLVQNVAQKYTTSTHTAIILVLEAVFGTIFSVIFLDELLSKSMIVGFVIIFIAILITEVNLDITKIFKARKLEGKHDR